MKLESEGGRMYAAYTLRWETRVFIDAFLGLVGKMTFNKILVAASARPPLGKPASTHYTVTTRLPPSGGIQTTQ